MSDPADEANTAANIIAELIDERARKIVGKFLLGFVLQLEQWNDPTVQKVKGALVLLLQEEFFDPKAPGGIGID